MIAPAPTCLIFLIVFYSGVVFGGEWSYGDEEHWPKMCKEGRKQSPIALTKHVAEEVEYSAFIFEKYYADYPVQSKNNGHSAEIRLHVRDQPSVRGGGLPELYVLDHLHFHWQSEHTIDNYRFPLELHLVHFASKYNNVSNALNYRDGVAVFSVLFDLSPDDDREFEPLITVIDKLHDKVDKIEQLTFNIQDYLPRDTAGFYRYNGSLTTPGCTEGIIWTVFTNTLPISKNQVRSFTLLQTKERKELPKNYRSLQALNGRRIFLRVSPIRNSSSSDVYNSCIKSRLFIFLIVMHVFIKLI